MNLFEAIREEKDRVLELIRVYRTLGPQCAFAIMMHEQTIAQADKAVQEQDAAAMVRALAALRECQ